MDDGQTAAVSDALPPRSVGDLRTRSWIAASPGVLVALGLFSAGGILLELALTRLLSTLYYPPYVFGVLSQAARWLPGYFAAVGLGFMALEVALIQQTRLFLGHPTLAVTAVLGVLLVGGGLAWLLGWPWLSRTFFQADLGVRLGVVVMALLPLALLMGMPFPLGLRVAGRLGRSQVALAWAVNGVLTVVGSVGGVALALRTGFTGVLWAALVAYLLAAATAWYTARVTRGTSCPTAKRNRA